MSTSDDKKLGGQGRVASAGGRPRNAAVTRADILAAARHLFTARGYGGVGVRDIGAAAGVNAALVPRYFGSKLGLFDEAVSSTFAIQGLIEGERSAFGERVARHVLTKDTAGQAFNPTLAMLRSAANPEAAASMRTALEQTFVGPLAEWIGGPGAERRAALILAIIAGLAVVRDVVGMDAQLEDVDALTAEVGASLQRLVDP